MVLGALLHDLGDDFAPANHSQYAAAIVRPYVREEIHWIVAHFEPVDPAVIRPAGAVAVDGTDGIDGTGHD